MKTHHISLLTEDADQNINFYTGVLGLRFIKNSVNQANPRRRHVYYGDFMGTPGTVVTFFPVPFHGRERHDTRHFFQGIHFSIPTGATAFWAKHLTDAGFPTNVDEFGVLHALDPDKIPLEFHESDAVLFDWHINYMTDVPYDKQITGVIGTELHVTNPAATAKFFKDMFDVDTKHNVINLEDNQQIFLVETPTDDAVPQWGAGSIDHFALGADSQAELDAYWDRAEALGYTRELMVDRGYFRSVYFREPGGNRVEVATTNPGFILDESLFDLGTTFALPPRFEAERASLLAHYAKQGVHFDDAQPYTGTGHLSGRVEVIHGDETTTNN